MVKNPFRSPPLGEVIPQAMRKLEVQRVKLEQVTVGLRERDRVLFEMCVTAARKDRERAIICANELAEVRKLLKIVAWSQLSLERIILRLETIKELGDIIAGLKPALRTLKDVTKRLFRAMPEIASELEKVNASITQTLSTTRISSPQPITPYEVKTPAGEEILKEASTLLEQRLMERLPEPPTSVAVEEKEPKERIALAASCS